MRGLVFALGVAALACSARAPERAAVPAAASGPARSASGYGAPAGAATTEGAAEPPAAPPQAPAPTGASARPAVAEFPFDVERVLDVGVTALVVERPPHVAAVSARGVFIHTGKGWQEASFPAHPHFSSEAGVREIFYGRDYRARLIANVETDDGPDRSYFRWLPGGFRPALDELGPLAKKARPLGEGACPSCSDNRLVAVLGNEDPEIICRPRDVCVVKRVTGWSTFAAPPDVRLAAIFRGKAYLLAGRSLLSVEGDKSVQVLSDQGPWREARGLVVVDGVFWVLDASATLYRFDGQSFRSFVSPVGPPRALWGTSEAELWAGGPGGLARFDGERFQRVSALGGEVNALGGRGRDELWIGGSNGLHCAKRRR